MFASIAESFIQRFFGRYLKKFDSSNISIGVTGIITISNVQLRTDELVNFQLPYKPVSIFIGTLYADLPFVSGGNFDVRVSDVLVVVEKNTTDLSNLHPFVLAKALQLWIGALYFAVGNSDMRMGQSISSVDVEYIQRLVDRLCLTIENCHYRMEEVYTAHVPCPIGNESICLGAIISRIEIRPPTSQELQEDRNKHTTTSTSSTGGKPMFNTDGDTRTTRVMNKWIKLSKISAYCVREDCLGTIPDDQLTLEFVRKHCWHREKGRLIGPIEITAALSVVYQRANLVFGPINVTLTIDDIDVRITDEQLAYLTSVYVAFETHIHRLQLNSRLSMASAAPEPNRRARLRWAVLRDSIRVDWWRYAKTLEEGSLRWRAWMDEWRKCARYVAIREILLYHVGFETMSTEPLPSFDGLGKDEKPDATKFSAATYAEGNLVYSMSECLLADHHHSNRGQIALAATSLNGGYNARSKEEYDHLLTKKLKRRYQGCGSNSINALRGAEYLLTSHMTAPTPRTTEDVARDQDNALSLSPTAVRALYALQLELDTVLGVRVAAQCRLWAEERYKLRRLAQGVEAGGSMAPPVAGIHTESISRSLPSDVDISDEQGGRGNKNVLGYEMPLTFASGISTGAKDGVGMINAGIGQGSAVGGSLVMYVAVVDVTRLRGSSSSGNGGTTASTVVGGVADSVTALGQVISSSTHPLTHTLTYPLIHPLTHPLIHTLTHTLTHPLTHTPARSC